MVYAIAKPQIASYAEMAAYRAGWKYDWRSGGDYMTHTETGVVVAVSGPADVLQRIFLHSAALCIFEEVVKTQPSNSNPWATVVRRMIEEFTDESYSNGITCTQVEKVCDAARIVWNARAAVIRAAKAGDAQGDSTREIRVSEFGRREMKD